jgi:Protein kinase domain
MPLSIGQLLYHDRYRIDNLLAQGGMGAIYHALDLNLNMPVAIKENLDASPGAQKQFVHEANILARLSHPNLPRVLDYFFIPQQGQYLVMDFVEGEDLQSMLNRLGRLPEPQVLTWVSQICDALAYLHSQPSPIIHRDIKPANIRIRPDGRAMLVDFGIAKVFDPHLATTIGARAVTPGYSPPEQYGGGSTDARSDVYALGATIYHLLTGKAPPDSVKRMIRQADMLPPRQVNIGISPLVEQAILRSTELDTANRFQSIEELRAALARAATIPLATQTAQADLPPTLVVPASVLAPARSTAETPARPGAVAPVKPRPAAPNKPNVLYPLKAAPLRKRSSTGLVILAAFILTVLVLGVLGVGGYMLLGGKLPFVSAPPTEARLPTATSGPPVIPTSPGALAPPASPAVLAPPAAKPPPTEPPSPLPPEPERPTPIRYQPVGEIFIPDYPETLRAVQVKEPFAYILTTEGILDVFDLSGMSGAGPFISNSKVLTTLKMQNASGLRRVGDFLYVYGYAGFEILDLRDAANPASVKSIGDVPIFNMTPQGPILIAVGDSGISVYQVENPADPVRISFTETGKGILAFAAAVNGQFLYVSMLDQLKGGEFLRVYDFHDPANLQLIGEINHSPLAYHLFVVGGQMVACADSRLEVWKLDDPAHPQPVFDGPAPSRACVLDGQNIITEGLFHHLLPGRFETFDKFDGDGHATGFPYTSALIGNLVFYVSDQKVIVLAGFEK